MWSWPCLWVGVELVTVFGTNNVFCISIFAKFVWSELPRDAVRDCQNAIPGVRATFRSRTEWLLKER